MESGMSKLEIHPLLELSNILSNFFYQVLNIHIHIGQDLYIFAIAMLIPLGPLVTILTTELAFSNTRVMGKVGLFSTKTMDSPLNKIQNVSVEQSFLGKILGYSKVRISSAAGALVYKDIMFAEKFKQKLMAAIEAYEEEHLLEQAKKLAEAMNKS